MKLYMKCTTDALELPLAVADSPKELAFMLKANYGTIATMVSRQICGYHKIDIPEEPELYPDNDGNLWYYDKRGRTVTVEEQ